MRGNAPVRFGGEPLEKVFFSTDKGEKEPRWRFTLQAVIPSQTRSRENPVLCQDSLVATEL
ncbi:hypothetical protein KSX_69980 [Ktedonospora formicarum]|uniref:Uncharacterized protein n=1 Tax=Ktedonospora formicarum TaxID=2778364 RepID=A0A8J3MV16_9CHLR|nr:hypothetical protein KSX_69980 [Ktedonospora formicarum]